MELTDRLAEDLDEAFPDLIRHLQDRVFSTALRLARNRHDAEDLTQETFVRVYRALSGFPSERISELRLKPYVWTVLLNLSRNRARYAARHPESPTRTEDVVRQAPVAPPPDWVEAEQVWEPRLARLPRQRRTAVVLRHVAGLSYAEIAELLAVPVGTAKADVHRGLNQLRSMIESEGEVA